MFESKLLTADPKELIGRAKSMLNMLDDSLLRYVALDLRLALEIIIHNQITLSPEHKIKWKKLNDPKKKRQLMNILDPNSDLDYSVYYIEPLTKEKIFWGEYKNISKQKISSIEGKLDDLLHYKKGLNLGMTSDIFYKKTREFLEETTNYLEERIMDSLYYFSYTDVSNFVLERK